MNKGSTAPVIACTILFVMLGSAFASDIMYAAIQRYQLNSSTERLALSGAELLLSDGQAANRKIRLLAPAVAGEFSRIETNVADNGKEVSVSLRKSFQYLFLKVFGLNDKEMVSKVTIKLSGVKNLKGVRPFAVMRQKPQFGKKMDFTDNPAPVKDTVRLIPLNLGSGNYKNNLLFGYSSTLNVGDGVYPLEGSQAQEAAEALEYLVGNCRHVPKCTYNRYAENCSRILLLPVVEKAGDELRVAGFSALFVEGFSIKKDHIHIAGRFIKHAVDAGTSDHVADFGLAGIKIIK